MKNAPQSDSLRKEAVDYLKQALEIAKTHLPQTSFHITNINEKLSKYAASAD
jgi:hypothetical protein